jgi:hypothetical protein
MLPVRKIRAISTHNWKADVDVATASAFVYLRSEENFSISALIRKIKAKNFRVEAWAEIDEDASN